MLWSNALLPWVSQGSAGSKAFFFNVEIYCVITTALWSRDGSAVVSLHPPAASMESSVRFLQPSSLGGLAHRSGGSLQEETALEIKDE